MPSTIETKAPATVPAVRPISTPATRKSKPQRHGLASVNRELWLLLALFAIAAVLNLALDAQRMILGLYTLPTIYSAYSYGRRHAVLTALASICMVVLLLFVSPAVLHNRLQLPQQEWYDIAAWAGILLVTAYAMGSLYEWKEKHLRDLHQSYDGILMILQHIAADDKYSQNHPYRVSLCATKIAEQMGLETERVEDVRAAALLHEVDKVGISREILYRAANLSAEEAERIDAGWVNGKGPKLQGGALRRIVPIVLSYQNSLEQAQKGRGGPQGPLETRILMVADAYDSLTSARTARVSPSEAMQRIEQRAGIEYDADVVEAMVAAFRQRGLAE